MRAHSLVALAALVAGLTGGEVYAEPYEGPALAAASNFSQGRRAGTMHYAYMAGVDDFRDGTLWSMIETEPGASPTTAATPADAGAKASTSP